MKKILIVVVCLYAFMNLLYIIPLFTMGIANNKAAKKAEALLSEKSVWVDESGRYRLSFDPKKKYGVLEDQKNATQKLYIKFKNPGRIQFFENNEDCLDSNSEIVVGYADWYVSKDNKRESLIIQFFSNFSEEYRIYQDKEIIFYRQ